MNKLHALVIKVATISSVVAMVFLPLATINADSVASNSLRGIVSQQNGGTITINSITLVKNTGSADGTFDNGWVWVIDMTAPMQEQNLMMKFENWMVEGAGNSIIPAGGNIRFYSSQSSNAFNQANAIYINSPNAYAGPMFLTGDLDSFSQTRRVQITVETRIPQGTQTGTYSTNFGIQTQ